MPSYFAYRIRSDDCIPSNKRSGLKWKTILTALAAVCWSSTALAAEVFDPSECANPTGSIHFELISGIRLETPWPGVVPRLPPPGSYKQPDGPEPRGCASNPWIVQAVAVPFYHFAIAGKQISVERASRAVESIQVGGRTEGIAALAAGDARQHEIARRLYDHCTLEPDEAESCYWCPPDLARQGQCGEDLGPARDQAFSARIFLDSGASDSVHISCRATWKEVGYQPCSASFVLRPGLSISFRLDASKLQLEELPAIERAIRRQVLAFLT